MRNSILFLALVLPLAIQADTPTYDFGSAAFQLANGQQSFTSVPLNPGGESITLRANAYDIFHNLRDAKLRWTSGEGIGIDSWADDLIGDPAEIGYLELATTGFSPRMFLSYIDFSNLYNNCWDKDRALFKLAINGQLEANWEGPFTDDQNGGFWATDDGNLRLNINKAEVTGIVFQASGNMLSLSDFTIRGVGGVPAPEPASIVLMGSALVGLSFIIRKKTAHKG